MKLELEPEAREASFVVSPEAYGVEALTLAARVFERRAEVYVEEGRKGLTVTLQAKKALKAPELEKLAREFLNEALNQEYRGLVGAAHKNLAALLVTQALYSARGDEKPLPPLTPEQEAEAQRLMAEANEEIERTMPKKIPPQGAPLPAAEE